MAQIGTRPPRFSIQVNNRNAVTRDYAYFVENRLRERYGLDGIPLIIDFAERKQRRGASCRSRRARLRRRVRLVTVRSSARPRGVPARRGAGASLGAEHRPSGPQPAALARARPQIRPRSHLSP